MSYVLAKDLRNAVLQAAMSGRLTNQLSSDSDVFDLIKNIEKDRNNRIKNKEIKKDSRLNFNQIHDERFDIPNNWIWTTLGSILYKLTDVTHKTPKYSNTGIKFVSVKDMSNGKLSLQNTKFITKEEHNEIYQRCNPEKGDILLSKVGTTGVPAIVDTDEEFSLFVSVALLKFNHNFINLNFLYLLLKSPDVTQQAKENTRGIGNKNWVLDSICKTEIPLPPIEEQARIVAKVDELMAKIDEYEKLENELVELKQKFHEEMKASILKAAMEGKLTEQYHQESATKIFDNHIPHFNSDDACFDIPDNWFWCYLKNIAELLGGFAFKSTDYIQNGVRVIRISDFNENGFVDKNIVTYKYDDSLSKYLIKEKDILMCMTGGTVGKNYYIKKLNEDLLLNQRVANIRCKKVNSDFLNYIIKSPFIQNIIDENKNSTNDNISMNLIKNFPIPIPPIEEQQRIVDKLDQLLPLCDGLMEN